MEPEITILKYKCVPDYEGEFKEAPYQNMDCFNEFSFWLIWLLHINLVVLNIFNFFILQEHWEQQLHVGGGGLGGVEPLSICYAASLYQTS